MFLQLFNIVLIYGVRTSQSTWINYPENCTSISLQDGLRELCGGDQLMNIRNQLLDDTYKEIGEICTPNYSMEKKSEGYRCASIKKKVICKMLENFDHEVTYISESHPIDKAKCHELIINKDLLNNIEEPYYPPPKCDSSKSSVSELEFIKLINYDVILDPVGFQNEDNYLFQFDKTNPIPIDYIYQSEFCQSKNWICHGDKSYIPLEIFKGDNQASIRLELIKLSIIYDSNFGELPIRDACRLHYCGKPAIKLFNGAIIKIKESPIVLGLPSCNRSRIEMPETNLAKKRYSNVGPVLLTTLNKRFELCKKIKKNLELKQPIPINNLHYLAPFEPGKHPALVYRLVSTTINQSLRNKVVPVSMLSMSMCEYITGQIIEDGIKRNLTDEDTVIILANNKEIKWKDLKGRENWYQEQANPNIIDKNPDHLSYYWYNGVMRREDKFTYPSRYILQTLKKIYTDTERESRISFFKFRLERNITKTEVIKFRDIEESSDQDHSQSVNKTLEGDDYWNWVEETTSDKNKTDGSRGDEKQTIQNKEYWNEESSIWGISTIITVLGIYYIYRKNRREKIFLNMKHRVQRFFKLDY
ncbi:non-structural transmembrane glycoprotein GNS [Bovine ephemeral fever virus]|uniref:Non-structural glycoprotein GNS n=1 Tax=Bovine ephemeral fever virus (strain BB7721) TaxID=928297 RepID=VGLN_BEFVB|nr:non-structural transmembrane glycoprotein GNS [Bovine ephemeral fever virus]P32596.1 RecName: Full=Non-structural glycoprotein GNS; Flags: Precursor [Bovine ephemeral fever virus strain BB7721]AAA42761.1 nonstructural glycoprotein [Bovine ephemeral fever virus]AAG10414.1 non-structural transmembrane glycoprotein GNS [Bovine ephemeral fever virus]